MSPELKTVLEVCGGMIAVSFAIGFAFAVDEILHAFAARIRRRRSK